MALSTKILVGWWAMAAGRGPEWGQNRSNFTTRATRAAGRCAVTKHAREAYIAAIGIQAAHLGLRLASNRRTPREDALWLSSTPWISATMTVPEVDVI